MNPISFFRIEDFIEYLIEALTVVVNTLSNVTFTINAASFSVVDSLLYAGIIGSVLSFISSHYSGGRFKVGRTSFKDKPDKVSIY